MGKEPFRRAQDAWSERLLRDPRFFDAVAVLGPGAERVPFLSALVANVSEPLDKALYGAFREGATKEVVLPEVTPAAFGGILRAAAHLDPGLSADTVVPTMQAAQMYMIRELEEECVRFLGGVDAEDLLRVLSLATTTGFPLPDDVYRQIWCTILLESERVLRAGSFVHAHGSIVSRLLRLDEFGVCEEELWSRLEEWASCAADNPGLAGPLAGPAAAVPSAEGGGKRPRFAEAHEGGRAAILQPLARHFRFTVMDKEFFCDRVRPLLSRDASDAVMMYHVLGRPPGSQSTSKRSGIRPAEEVQAARITSFCNPQQAVNLSAGSGEWEIGFGYPLVASLESPVYLTKVCLIFGAEHAIWPEWELTCGTDSGREHPTCAASGVWSELTIEGRVGTIIVGRPELSDRLQVVAKRCGQMFWPMAALKGIKVYGKKSRDAYVVDVVNRLSMDVLMQTPATEGR